MTGEAIAVNVCAIIIASAGMAKSWYIAKGRLRLVYWLMIIMGLFQFVLNSILVAFRPDLWGILAFQFLVVWTIVMGIKGLLRLKKEEK